MKTIALILSGGVGERMGSKTPKQYIEIEGKPILYYSLKSCQDHEAIDAIMIGAADEWQDYILKSLKENGITKPIFFSKAGITRQHTILYGLQKMKELGYADDDLVVIQDGVRPYMSKDEIDRCIEEIKVCDYVLPGNPAVDTVFLCEDGINITGLLNRSALRLGSTPDVVRIGRMLELFSQVTTEELMTATNLGVLAVKHGYTCHIVEGCRKNFKITTAEDIEKFKMYLALDKE